MIKCRLFVCSLGAVIDQRTNNLSLFNILSQVHSAGFPLLLQRVYVTAVVTRDEGDPDPQFNLLVTSVGQQVIDTPFAINFQGAKEHRSILEISGFPVSGPGSVVFTLKTAESTLATYSIEVSLLDKPLVESIGLDAKPPTPASTTP